MTNDDVLHGWLDRRSTFGKPLNTDGEWLFSYRMPIARHSRKCKTVLILIKGPTKTTQRHINRTRELCKMLCYHRVMVSSLQVPSNRRQKCQEPWMDVTLRSEMRRATQPNVKSQ